MITPVERVAEAMKAADEKTILVGWDCFADETIVDWMALAQAAIDALGLKEEHALYDEPYPHMRLVGPWIEVRQ